MKSTVSLKPCKTCEYRGAMQDGSPACAKFKVPIPDIETNGCTWHHTNGNSLPCELCHSPAEQIIIYQYDEDKELCLCEDCYNKLHTCHTCKYGRECGFNSDFTMPKYVMQNVQKGFMTMQTQVKNPTLVEKHCSTCRCSIDDKGTCAKETEVGQNCPHWMILS